MVKSDLTQVVLVSNQNTGKRRMDTLKNVREGYIYRNI